MGQFGEIEATAANYLEFMIHGFMNGLITLQELEGISDDEMEMIYALGFNFFTYGKYDAAKDIFGAHRIRSVHRALLASAGSGKPAVEGLSRSNSRL